MAARLTRLRRGAALGALVGAVALVHGCIVREVGQQLSGLDARSDMPERMKAVYVRSMERVDPVPVAKAAPAPRRKRVPAPAVPEPEAPEPAASAPVPVPEPEPVLEPVAEAASVPVVVPVDVAASAPPFEWPLATRVTFDLTGNYRGPIHGDAQVEWVRQDDAYQVHLDVSVGPSLAPFMSRRMTSQGRITPDGLRPERYDQETKLPFSNPTRAIVLLEDQQIQLANGQRRERWPGVQDTASQFVQLAFQFTTQPALLTPGAVITVPLAMPRSVTPMLYDVSEPETLWTSFGEIPVYRLKPRLVPRAGGDLAVEMWIAPQYRYLPIRLKIHQDAETYVDLMIRKPPELGGGPEAPASR
ncbi:DUF3108 domain-containing protein [Piscinibacter gummiphilus]|uniref:Uncharacterized protein n=1 Tax=Piscinibacter gummiphilus TaxID=946333 RepID=A0A1W6LEJ6_9BURK|nr:DUF3108 domain-containing protein [Piscinibacter gummiphilus]ARN22660.1 hypothetical protein A4W93_23620 [Piscinibacter gummiphilus]ATU67358.1 DUF3108 domain-containing protein [Piscinibacter gummiphilus]GLS97704.1 hypothetical protein GCM10007918_49960 [Piscinibacter gummiphilus]